MAIASPPNPTDAAPVLEPAPSSSPGYEFAPAPPELPERRQGHGVAGGVILIALGIAVLFNTWFPAGGAWLFLGLGAAFLVARVATGRSGYAVPAGILLGFGSFVWFSEVGLLTGPGAGGMFFVFLGLGFLASYAIAGRPEAVWPVLPGVLLIGFGAFLQATMFGTPFAQYWWLAQYWPVSLIVIGVWVLIRNQIPAAARTPIAVIGASVLILIGLLVAAAGVATVATPDGRGSIPMPMLWPMGQMPFGGPPIQDSLTLSAPTAGIASIRVANPSGRTVVRATEGSTISVQATRHYWSADRAPTVQLVPSNGVLVVEATPVGVGFGEGTSIDYVIDAPSALGADVRAASGSIDLSGLDGPIRLETASGAVDARDLPGTTVINTASGGVRLANVSGDLQVTSVSGSVTARFASSASAHIDATSVSGDVNASDLGLTSRAASGHALSGNIGSGGHAVSIHTTSGSIRLQRAS